MKCERGIFAFSKKQAKALAAHASRDSTRTFLYGVTLEPARGRAFASDGHRALVGQCSGEQWCPGAPPCVVPINAWDRAVQAMRARDVLRIQPPGTAAPAADGEQALPPPARNAVLAVSGPGTPVWGEPGNGPAALQVAVPDCDPPPVDAILPQLDSGTLPAHWLRRDPTVLPQGGSDARRLHGDRQDRVLVAR